MELHTSLGKKLKLATALALTATLLLSGAGCARDENPPVIQQTNMPEWAVEGEYIDLSVRTTDDRGVQGAYIQFGSGDKIPLARTDSQQNGEEVAKWEISLNLAPNDYTYRIVARDRANEVSKEGKITVYSKNSVHGYASNKNIRMYLPQLLSLEDDGVVDNNEKAFIDLVAEYPKAGELVPGIYAELLLLPDLSIEKYSKLDEKDLGAVEKILSLASDPQYKTAFDTMLSTGIPDGRKY